MTTFSQRMGLSSARTAIQKDSMDVVLRNGLWNCLDAALWSHLNVSSHSSQYFPKSNLYGVMREYWINYFNAPVDEMPQTFARCLEQVKGHFMNCKWNVVYDFIEFSVKYLSNHWSSNLITLCNRVLEKELSAYRIIDKHVVEISAEAEIKSIEDAFAGTSKLGGVQTHLKQALQHLADRKNPDFRNSIKESISSVESLAQVLTGKTKATLGEALQVLESQSQIHPALKKSLAALYGYTSDAQGIRHAMLDEATLAFDDAKFMLVSCTAFINYLVSKAAQTSLKLA